jgi:probable phosphoglycerate mutase
MAASSWPSALWLVRHGESVGNAASERAWRDGAEVIDVAERDADVDLTERGVTQAETLGRWMALMPEQDRPQRVLVSTYVRAQRTADLALAGLEGDLPRHTDERLRDREMGVLDRLTQAGIEARQPEEAAMRARLGKFYHRPSGGESWCDVALRLRSVVSDLRRDHAGERVIIFAHDIVVLLFRYLIEGLDERGVLEVAQHTAVRNCGVTWYDLHQDRGLVLRHYNAVIDPDGTLHPGEATRG